MRSARPDGAQRGCTLQGATELLHRRDEAVLAGGETGRALFPPTIELAAERSVRQATVSSGRSSRDRQGGACETAVDKDGRKSIGEISIDGLIGYVPHPIRPEEGAAPHCR